eukprot:1156777-Pelagomonas_calceolata.AAC.1
MIWAISVGGNKPRWAPTALLFNVCGWSEHRPRPSRVADEGAAPLGGRSIRHLLHQDATVSSRTKCTPPVLFTMIAGTRHGVTLLMCVCRPDNGKCRPARVYAGPLKCMQAPSMPRPYMLRHACLASMLLGTAIPN